MKLNIREKSSGKLVCCYQNNIIRVPDTGQLYQGSMNVTDRYTIETVISREFKVKREKDSYFFRKIRPSRGWHIIDTKNPTHYLHTDGLVKFGIKTGNSITGIWPTEKEAKEFLVNYIPTN